MDSIQLTIARVDTLFIIGAGYLLGSIPFGYLLVRFVRGEDVRRSGSGNIGATNVSRKSPALGILTLLLDSLKGFAAVILGAWSRRPLRSQVEHDPTARCLSPHSLQSLATSFPSG